jgi:hypothetical protein
MDGMDDCMDEHFSMLKTVEIGIHKVPNHVLMLMNTHAFKNSKKGKSKSNENLEASTKGSSSDNHTCTARLKGTGRETARSNLQIRRRPTLLEKV